MMTCESWLISHPHGCVRCHKVRACTLVFHPFSCWPALQAGQPFIYKYLGRCLVSNGILTILSPDRAEFASVVPSRTCSGVESRAQAQQQECNLAHGTTSTGVDPLDLLNVLLTWSGRSWALEILHMLFAPPRHCTGWDVLWNKLKLW